MSHILNPLQLLCACACVCMLCVCLAVNFLLMGVHNITPHLSGPNGHAQSAVVEHPITPPKTRARARERERERVREGMLLSMANIIHTRAR